MGTLEAGTAIVFGKFIEGFKMPWSRDEYYDVVVVPGFSDGHAHPQVVDVGLVDGRKWADSYDWIENRRLRVDEAAIRADVELSSRLAELVYKRALLEGTTLIAVTGRLEANYLAWKRSPDRPRVAFLPTVMKKKGWATPGDIARLARDLAPSLSDNLTRLGVFVHSLRYAGEMLPDALNLAKSLGGVLGLHLSEGRREMHMLARHLRGRRPWVRVVAVHCMEDEDPSRLGVSCVGCPGTNMILYGRTRKTLKGVTSFGSDWPLLLGTVPMHLGLIKSLYPGRVESIMERATIGGYHDYGLSHQGDLAAYDGKPSSLLEGRLKPRMVSVAGKITVYEGRLASTGETHQDVLKKIDEAIREAIEMYPIPQLA